MKAIMPVFDENSTRPYYLMLYDYIKDAILSGDITEGEKLPSLRALSRSTGLSLTTVGNAYNQLLVEGYIQSRPSSGYYADRVAGTGTGSGSPSSKKATVPSENKEFDIKLFFDNPVWPRTGKVSTDNSDPSSQGVSGNKEAAASGMRFDPDCFDFNKWKKCMNRVLNENSSTLFFEGSPQGESALRDEISDYLYRSRGVTCDPTQIFIGAGTQQITGLLATFLRDLDIEHVALEDPGYEPVRNMFRDRGFAITDIEVDDNGILLEHLPANIRAAAYVSPSNNSFSGSVMPVGRRYEMLRWAISNDSYIIEDDYDSELRYFGKPIPPIKSLGDEDRVIYLGSFSSTLFAAVRISYMVLPQEIASDFAGKLSGYSQTCSKLEQLTLANFMETGLYQTHIRKLRKLYSNKLAALTDVLKKEASDLVDVINNASGLSLLIRLDIPSSRLKKAIKDAESLGISAVTSGELILLYYHQIPLKEIPSVFSELISRWRI